MNQILYNNKIYNYINYYSDGTDSFGKKFPNPVILKKKRKSNNNFIKNLEILQKLSIHKISKNPEKCKICNKKINTGIYIYKNNVWQDSLLHYYKNHNIKINKQFENFVEKKKNKKDQRLLTFKIKRQKVLKYQYEGKYNIKLSRNHLNILDALLYSGGNSNIYEINNSFYFSEHFGLLDFNKKKLKTILIDANTKRIDQDDNTILLPTANRPDIDDYEYIFHTHPPENGIPGGRRNDGILYEFPSVSDISHFISLTYTGIVNGSIVNTAEGLYIIKRICNCRNKTLKLLSNTEETNLNNLIDKQQNNALKKYGTKFTDEFFYKTIAKNKVYLKNINKFLKDLNITILFYNRIKNKKNKWVLPEITITVDVYEQK